MEIREIEAFLALGDELHFGLAASRLGVSSSRISQLIQALERRVGGQLAVRDGHGVRLTDLGEQLLAGARPGYARLERAISTPAVRLGTWSFITGTVASELCAEFERAHPGNRAEWSTVPIAEMYQPLERHGVDVLMLLLPGPPDSCPVPPGISVGLVLSAGTRVLVVPDDHPLAARAELTAEDLADCHLIAPADPGPPWHADAWHPAVTPGGRDIPHVRTPPIRHPDELFSHIARRGLAVIGPPWTLDDFPWPGLTAVPIRGLAPIHLVLAAREQEDEPLVAEFLRVAARTPVLLGHGSYVSVAGSSASGMRG